MPSDFVEGRAGPPKTLADLIRQLHDGPPQRRAPFTSSPVAGPGRFRQGGRQESNKETEPERRSRLAKEALKSLGK